MNIPDEQACREWPINVILETVDGEFVDSPELSPLQTAQMIYHRIEIGQYYILPKINNDKVVLIIEPRNEDLIEAHVLSTDLSFDLYKELRDHLKMMDKAPWTYCLVKVTDNGWAPLLKRLGFEFEARVRNFSHSNKTIYYYRYTRCGKVS